MSMLCSLCRLTPAQADIIARHPDAVGALLGDAPAPPSRPGLLGRLFGRPAPVPPALPAIAPLAEAERFDLDQAWHILHFLFVGAAEGGALPAGFILEGDTPIGRDLGYGPPRLLDPAQTRDVAAFLDQQSHGAFDAAYDSARITAAELYWQVASSPGERVRQVAELWDLAARLRGFLRHSTETGASTLIEIA